MSRPDECIPGPEAPIEYPSIEELLALQGAAIDVYYKAVGNRIPGWHATTTPIRLNWIKLREMNPQDDQSRRELCLELDSAGPDNPNLEESFMLVCLDYRKDADPLPDEYGLIIDKDGPRGSQLLRDATTLVKLDREHYAMLTALTHELLAAREVAPAVSVRRSFFARLFGHLAGQ